ncbi:MAG TPA: hypothetical protein VMM93_09860 [Vicinamibacterales bacterium]|nr:hypothetical protein [Vicinamibacterales bacterium]
MVLAVVDDLLFASRIRSAAEHAGAAIAFVRSRGDVVPRMEASPPALVILDLDRDALDPIGLIREIRGHASLASTRIVAFVRHTNGERIAEARVAGINQVLARSAFFPALGQMLAAPAAS